MRMTKDSLTEWFKLSDGTRLNVFLEVSNRAGLPAGAIEKDWWVIHTLELIFSMECAPHTVFKGGTSLSKAWGLIERFSEDIDLALDRKFLGFDAELSRTQITKLRKKSYKYISNDFINELRGKFDESGFNNIVLRVKEVKDTDQDPLIIEIQYPNLTETLAYINPRVLVEIGSRSLKEPFTIRTFNSIVGGQLSDRTFADKPIDIPSVNPERTFLEKIFLLHEEFQKPAEKIRGDRLSRHLYDIEKLMDTEFADKAFEDKTLYDTIVEHRKKIISLKGINYDLHTHDKISFFPPDDILGDWEKDYKTMQESMIYGTSLPFDQLIIKLKALNKKINNLNW